MHKKPIVILIGLILLLGGGTAGAEENPVNSQIKDNKTQTAKYSPYPDVWDWQAPKVDRPVTDFYVKAMDDGDFMILYRQARKNGKIRTVSFFGRTDVKDYNAVFKDDYTSDAKSRIPFKENTVLWTTGGGWRSGGCLDALDYHVTIQDESGQKLLISKTLLYIFDKPLRYKTYPHCMNGPSFNYQVAAVAADFLRLKDGTFLLVAHVKDNAYIIRFDENFQTKSKLINEKFFWMDTDALGDFDAKYGDRVEGDKRLKQLYADLYRKLMNIKNGREK